MLSCTSFLGQNKNRALIQIKLNKENSSMLKSQFYFPILVLFLFCTFSFSITVLSSDIKGHLVAGFVRGDGIFIPSGYYSKGNWNFNNINYHSHNPFSWFCYDSSDKPFPIRMSTDIIEVNRNTLHSCKGYLTSYVEQRKFNPDWFYPSALAFTSDTLEVSWYKKLQKDESPPKIVSDLIKKLFEENNNRYLIEAKNKMDLFSKEITKIAGSTSNKKIDTLIYSTYSSLKFNKNKSELIYFSVKKKFKREECPLIAQLKGWILFKENNFKPIDIKFGVDDCDEKFIYGKYEPYAIVSIDNKQYIFASEIGYEYDLFDILEITNDSIKSTIKQ
jgi:hypothetical protein